jgi:hypothetical protein
MRGKLSIIRVCRMRRLSMASTKLVRKFESYGYAANRLRVNDEFLPGGNQGVLPGILYTPKYCGAEDVINHIMVRLFTNLAMLN